MKRKQFLLSTVMAMPALALAQFNLSENHTNKPFIVRSGRSRTGDPIKFQGIHPNNVVISRKDTDNALSVFDYTGLDKVGPPLHMHMHQDEFFYVVEGKYRFVAGEEKMELNIGDTIFLPRNVPHTWIQLTNKGRLLYAVQPAGTLEDFFMELNALKKPPTEKEAKEIFEKHGMKLLGPELGL
jgi:quercetin 2,3-dioxygenase